MNKKDLSESDNCMKFINPPIDRAGWNLQTQVRLLFIKYVSDKYAGQRYAPITIPDGTSFADLVALKGKSDIGDQINKKIVAPLTKANKLSDFPDFNDAGKRSAAARMRAARSPRVCRADARRERGVSRDAD